MKSFILFFIFFIFCSSFAEAKPNKDLAIQRVKSLLEYPESAEFKDVVTDNDEAVCGMVRAKNSLGTYTDYRYFVSLTDREPKYTYVEGVGHASHIFLELILPSCGIDAKVKESW